MIPTAGEALNNISSSPFPVQVGNCMPGQTTRFARGAKVRLGKEAPR